jgi:3'-phosphoadenosine 5'-phosphosulfate sulfotransferase
MSTQEVLDKYFKYDKVIFFQSSDYHKIIEGETSLSYKKTGKVELWFSGNNGDVCLIATTDGEKLEAVIKAIIYG